MENVPVRANPWVAFVITLVLGFFVFVLLTVALQTNAMDGWLVLAYVVLVVLFGVLAPSRAGAFVVPFLVPFLQVAQCGTTDSGLCGSELGFPAYLFVAWFLVMLPMLLGAGLGWALGVRWRGALSIELNGRPRPPDEVAP